VDGRKTDVHIFTIYIPPVVFLNNNYNKQITQYSYVKVLVKHLKVMIDTVLWRYEAREETPRKQRLDAVRRLFLSVYCSGTSCRTFPEANGANSGISGLLENFAEKVGFRGSSSTIVWCLRWQKGTFVMPNGIESTIVLCLKGQRETIVLW